MSKQRPSADKMTNELAGASAFFRPASPTPSPLPIPTQPVKAEPPVTPAPHIESAPARTPRTAATPERRQMVRHAFEIYLDQIESLRAVADVQRRRGEPASMSRMVRDALDQFLTDHPDHTK